MSPIEPDLGREVSAAIERNAEAMSATLRASERLTDHNRTMRNLVPQGGTRGPNCPRLR